MEENAIELNNLKVGIGNFNVKVNKLTLKPGQIMCLMGPNGSGKTTLLKSICGLIKPTGKVKIFGKPLDLSNRRSIAYISQKPNLFRGSVFYNISYPLKIRGCHKHEIEKRVRQIVNSFRISHLIEKNILALSDGEARKVSIARALVYKPNVLLLDELLNGLDSKSRDKILKDVVRIVKKENIAAMYVTHRKEEAVTLGDKIAFMNKGKVEQIDSVKKVFALPANKTVAEYLGSENIYKAEVKGWRDGLSEVNVNGNTALVCSNIKEGPVIFCLRPENIFVGEKIDAKISARNHWEGKVTSLIDKGSFVKMEVDCSFQVNVFLTHQAVEEMGIKMNQAVGIFFKATSVHLIKDRQ